MTTRNRPAALWASRWGFVLAATGSAVGLGNIWKFPYMTGEYGGGAFVLVYLACILVIGVPIMMAEIALGRRGRRSPVGSIKGLVAAAGASRVWQLLGWMAMLCGFMILSFYVVVAGWSLSWLWKSVTGGLDADSVEGMAAIFAAHNADPLSLGFWSTLVTLITMVIVGRGVQAGIERSVRWMMPGMVVMLALLIAYAMFSGGFEAALHFLFAFEAGSLSGEGLLAAMGHAFFTLSLAAGAIMTYGAYLSDEHSIARTTFTVAICDTLVALMAGLAIFPIIFANGMDPAGGPGLIFMSLPLAFAQMPFGTLLEVIFFVMLTMAALTSAISMIEATVAWLSESGRFSRQKAAWGTGVVLWLVSTLAMLSFNLTAEATLWGRNFFDWLDYLTSRWMMPLGGLGMALLAGFVLKSAAMRDELGLSGARYALWLFMVRYASPLGILVVFIDALGIAAIDPASQWPWLLGALLVLTVAGETLSPRLRREAIGRAP